MHRKRGGFRGGVVTLRREILRPGLLGIAALTAILMLGKFGFSLPLLPASFLLTSMDHTVISLSEAEKKTIHYSAYDLLADSILSIQASETMIKKYAAKYGGVVKKEGAVPQHTAQPEVLNGNIAEIDASASGLTFINTPGYAMDKQALLDAPLSFSSPYNGPRVLIVHTHTSEAYAESADFRSEDPTMNVVSVGAEIAAVLRKEGIETIHDTTQNDNPSYNQSYKKALSIIESNLTAHPTLEVVLDIHRDYIKRDDGSMVKPTITTKDGQKAAQIMFVMGTDNMGLYHPNWRHNLSFSAKIQNHLNQTQPGLCRSINIRTERFNQHATKGSMIIEVGTGVNTLEEAKLSGRLVGEAIAAVLKECAQG